MKKIKNFVNINYLWLLLGSYFILVLFSLILFAHGFLTLEDNTEIFYKCDNFYNPQSEAGIIWNDRDLNIEWNLKKYKINKGKLIISEKDKKNMSFKEYKKINNIK